MLYQFRALALGLLAGTLAATSAMAQDGAEVHQRFGDFIVQKDRFSVDIAVDFHVNIDGQTESLATQTAVAIERPKQFSYTMATPDVTVEFYGDGEEIVTHIPDFGQYITGEQLGTSREVLGRAGFGPLTDVMMIVAEIVGDDPFANLLAVADSVEYVAQETIRGNEYDRVRVELDGMGWDAWFARGDEPLLYRLAPRIGSLIENFETMGESVEVDIIADFENWKFDENVAGEQLAFLPEDAAREVNEFVRPTPSMQLIGNPAPDIQLSKLGGGEFDLASLQGDEIVVLDFWATWCGPCRVAMPIIDQVTGEFADQGVRLYAVNLQESAEDINAFLTEEGIDVTVVLDETGSAANDYRAEAIPQTVIVGKDGIVEAVHVGVLPNLEQKLREELQTLVDGGSLLGSH